MSSEHYLPVPGSRKRRLPGACDLCRQKKVKCDSANMPDNRCSNCIAFNSVCSRVAALSKKPGRWHKGHVSDNPIAPVADLQTHINGLLSTTEIYTIPTDPTIVRAVMVDLARYVRQLEAQVASLQPKAPSLHAETDSEHELDENSVHLTSPLRQLTVGGSPARHYGKSSCIMLIKTAMDIKHNTFGPLSVTSEVRRPEFWTAFPIQRVLRDPEVSLSFPSSDLLLELVQVYLSTVNLYLGLLHAPSFRRAVAAGTHCTSHAFGNLVLAVCAVASRHTTHPKVEPGHDAGWQWFRQIRIPRPSDHTRPPTLWELQLYPLMTVFQYSGACPEICWQLAGAGIRLAQDVGAHRKRPMNLNTWTIEDELWKRAFWAQVVMDVFVSAITGRPRATNSEHYDLDMPLEVDDEYWPGEELADPTKPWTQNTIIPSKTRALVLHLKLIEILSFAQNTIYTVRRPEQWDAMGAPAWSQNVAVTLDSELNKWQDSVPPYLRWDDNNPCDLFFNESAILYTTYFLVQIYVHRSFLPRVRPGAGCGKPGLTKGFPSIIVCGGAARFCCHVLHVHAKRGIMPFPHMLTAVFQSGIHLLLNMWGSKKLGISNDTTETAKDVEKCMEVLAFYETRHQIAGRYHDILRELHESGVPPEYRGQPTKKRPREGDVEGARGMPPPATQQIPMAPQWALPIHTNDLLMGWTPPTDVDTSLDGGSSGDLDLFLGTLEDGISVDYGSWDLSDFLGRSPNPPEIHLQDDPAS